MKRGAEGRFERFLAALPESTHRLPLLHVTNLYSFIEICAGDSIEPQHCRHFGKNLLYTFYGRPAYRTKSAEFTNLSFNWPVVFIIDPDKIADIEAIYPFDTGAFFTGLYERYFSSQSRVEDFQLPGSLEYASKLVSTFYTNEKQYLHGRSFKNLELPLDGFEAQGVAELAREPSFTHRESGNGKTRDERSSAIEVQLRQRIEIKNSAAGIILPADYLTIPTAVSASERRGFKEGTIHTYEVTGFHGPDSLVGKLYQIVEEVYNSLGYL